MQFDKTDECKQPYNYHIHDVHFLHCPPNFPTVCAVSSFPTFQKQLLGSMLIWTGFCEVITCVELCSLRPVYLLSFNLMPWAPSTMLCDSVAFGSCGRVIPPPAYRKIHLSVQIADRFLAPTRKAVVNIQVQIFTWIRVAISPVTTRGWDCWVTGRYVRTTWEAKKCFQGGIPINNSDFQHFQLLHILAYIQYSHSLIPVIPAVGLKVVEFAFARDDTWYDVTSSFSCVHFPFIYLLWWHVCSNHLSFFFFLIQGIFLILSCKRASCTLDVSSSADML